MKNTILLFVLVVAAAALDSESEEQTDAPNFTYAGQLPDQVQELPDSGEVPAANKADTTGEATNWWSSLWKISAPVTEEAAPVEEAVPAEESVPVEEAVPAEEAAPVEEAAPAEESAAPTEKIPEAPEDIAAGEATNWWNSLREASATVEEAAAPTEKIPEAPEAAEEMKKEDTFSKEIMRLEERISQLEDAERSRQAVKLIVRTCDELKAYDPSKASGLDLVDPDGPFGDDPVPAFCDMTTGATLVSHDAADGAEVDCSGRSCFTQNVQYEASYRQLVALTRLSLQCTQLIQLTTPCSALDKLTDPDSSWWQDRLNATHSFADCAVETEEDKCSLTCSLTSSVNALPVQALAFGSEGEDAFKFHATLGKLECVGNMQGAKGDTGPQGPPGPPGPQGAPGPKGEAGVQAVARVKHEACPDDIGPSTRCHNVPFTGCYCFVMVGKTWSMARDYCRAHAMELVSIETEEERAKLNAIIPATNYEGWWTSGSDEGHEGQWMWTANGQPFSYAYWAKKQPDGGSIENYLLLKRFTFYWHDSEGNYGHEFSICESTVE